MKIGGKCNQCGICCFVGPYKCEHLDIGGIPGNPLSTRCRVYDKRFTDMPIMLIAPTGAFMQGYCLHNSKAEDMELAKLIVEGQCSMEIHDG